MHRVAHGFTLVELMIVVAITGVLAVVAGTAYRKYMDSARTTEAYSMLGEIRVKEEAFRAERSQYLGWSTDETVAGAFPAVDNAGCGEPCQKSVTVVPAAFVNWTTLGINPGRATLQCGYNLIAGGPGAAITAAPGAIGQALFQTNGNIPKPWWYAIATCDNDGKSTKNATFATTSDTTVVSAQNEHQ